MMARSGGSLIVPVILVVVITLLLYFHWGLRGQVAHVHEEAKDLSGRLMIVQQEREELGAQVRRYTEQISQANREKKALEDQQRDCHAKLDELQVNLVKIACVLTPPTISLLRNHWMLASLQQRTHRKQLKILWHLKKVKVCYLIVCVLTRVFQMILSVFLKN